MEAHAYAGRQYAVHPEKGAIYLLQLVEHRHHDFLLQIKHVG
jgi:hypothetical protein